MDEIRLIFNKDEVYNFGLQESYFNNNKHAHNQHFKMLPFTVNSNIIVTDFTGVIGELIRVLGDKKLIEKFDLKQFNNNLLEALKESDEKGELLNIIDKLFIEHGNLAMFDLKSFNYIKATGSEIKMAQFLYTMFIDTKIKDRYKQLAKQEDFNVLHRLVYDALPELEAKDYDKEFLKNRYECLLPYVKEKFHKDFSFLMSNHDLIEKYLKRLLEYYYMFYVTQLAIKLNHFEKADLETIEKVYMTLSWEVASQTRRSYEYGWKYVKEHIDKLFIHAITFEILAHNNKFEKYTYKSINEESGEVQRLIEDIDRFINEYKQKKSDVDFSEFRFDESERSESELTTKVKELFQVIDYQFRNSKREALNKKYHANLTKFVQSNFGKRRGRSGYSFNITENDIIMFVQLVLGQNDGRLRLVALFEQFEARGLLFDRESKSKIVELLEKLNLLEKKSDSGDAQYVRSIL